MDHDFDRRMTRFDNAYLELDSLLLLFLILWDQRAVEFLFSVGWLSGTLAAVNLGSTGGSSFTVGEVGR